MAQVVDLAWTVGLRGEKCAVAAAIAKGESGLDAHAVGDTHLVDFKWGPSLGLWQIRSLKPAYLHLEPIRNANKLKDPTYNAKAMYRISSGGNNFGPWSVYTSGAYRRHLAAARRAVDTRRQQGGSGSTSGGGGDTDLPAGESPDVNIPAGRLPINYSEPRRTHSIWVQGGSASGYVGAWVTGGRVDLTSGEVSEITIEFLNPDLSLYGDGRHVINRGALLLWDGLKMQVAATELGQTAGGPGLTVTCRSLGAEKMKAAGTVYDDTNREAGAKNLSPTEYAERMLNQFAGQHLTFVGEGSARRSDIAPTRNDAGEIETPWATLQRLAAETGFICFEAANVLYFASPEWLAQRGVEVKVGWRNSWGDDRLDAIDLPKIRKAGYGDPATLTCKLPRWRGEQVAPGMRLVTKGIYGVPQVWLVSRVNWPIDGGIEPVTVDAVEPVNPTPTLPPDTSAGGTDDGSTGGGGSSPAPRGTRINDAQRITHFGRPGDGGRITTYRTPWGITVSVHRLIKDRFAEACEQAALKSNWRPRRIDSLSVRQIRGGSGWSLHSWPLAWDFFATGPGVPPPGGVWTPVNGVPDDFGRAFEALGFTWGKRWNRMDVPHIEWADYPPDAGGGSSKPAHPNPWRD